MLVHKQKAVLPCKNILWSLTLGVHALQGLQYLVCVFVCLFVCLLPNISLHMIICATNDILRQMKVNDFL